MNTLNLKQAFGRDLPKWPQLLITGEPVTLDQAKAIIIRTDTFLQTPPFMGGSRREARWVKWASKVMWDELPELYEKITSALRTADEGSLEAARDAFGSYHSSVDRIAASINQIPTSYIHNNWMNSSYIYGAHGWCSPTGVISHVDNVGKWPSVKCIWDDLVLLHKEFPFLKLTATLMDREHSEENPVPVVSFLVGEGEVVPTDADLSSIHYDVAKPDRSGDAFMKHLSTERNLSGGVPDDWILEIGELMRPKVKQAIKEINDLVGR